VFEVKRQCSVAQGGGGGGERDTRALKIDGNTAAHGTAPLVNDRTLRLHLPVGCCVDSKQGLGEGERDPLLSLRSVTRSPSPPPPPPPPPPPLDSMRSVTRSPSLESQLRLRLWYEWRAHVERREDRRDNGPINGGAYAGQGGCSTGNKGLGSTGDVSECKNVEGGGPYVTVFQNELGSSHCIYMP
jgi:hypothetical protein